MTSNTTEALGHVTSADVQQPRTIYVQFSEIGTIRKWAWEPFDKAEPLIAENGWVSDTPTLCATGDDGELADLFWRIKEKMPVHHEELLDLADRIEALSAEVAVAQDYKDCGCSYDHPDDICLGHMKLFERRHAALSAEVERLTENAKANNQLARMYKAQADEFRAKYVAAVGQD